MERLLLTELNQIFFNNRKIATCGSLHSFSLVALMVCSLDVMMCRSLLKRSRHRRLCSNRLNFMIAFFILMEKFWGVKWNLISFAYHDHSWCDKNIPSRLEAWDEE